MNPIKLHDIVMFKAAPNSGEMVVVDIKDRYMNYPHASNTNPVIFVKFWDSKKQEYNYDSFYQEALELVKKE